MKLLGDSKINKKTKFDVLLPLIFIVLTNLLAITSLECCIMTFLVFPVVIASAYVYCAKKSSRTNLFFIFSLLSALYLICLFEFFVPLLELLPQENFLFVLLIVLTLIFFSKTYQHSTLNRLGAASSSSSSESAKGGDSVNVNLIDAEEKQCDSDDDLEADDRNSCPTCRKFIPARTFHCNVCKSCIIGRDHHNYFINCCVGRFNHKYFIFGCIACFTALLLFANLALTSICHPFPLFKIFGVLVLLPDDCQDVFRETEIALCFVGAIYAIELAVALLIVIIHQFVLISKGTTSTEFWSHKERSSRNSCVRNWKNFCYI